MKRTVPTLSAPLMGWYTTIEDSVVANKDYVYEEGDLLETHWIFEEYA